MIKAGGAVNEIPECRNPQDTEDGRLPHDDFPAVEEKSQELPVDSRKQFIEVAVKSPGGETSNGRVSRSVYQALR